MNKFKQILLFILFFVVVISCNDNGNNYSDKNKYITSLFDKVVDVESDSLKKKLLDSIYLQIDDYPIKDSVPKYYLWVSEKYYNYNYYDEALVAGRKSLELNKEVNDSVIAAQSMYMLGNIFYYGKSENDTAYVYYAQSEKLFQELGDYNKLGRSKLYKAYILYNEGVYQLCETEAVRALGLLQGRNSLDIYNCHNVLAAALDGQGMYDEAISYYELAFRQLSSFDKEVYGEDLINYYKAVCYNNMATTYVDMGEYEKPQKLFRDALNYTSKESNPSMYAKLINNLAYAKFKSGDFAGVPEMFFESLEIRDSIKNISGIVSSKMNLAEYYAYKKDTLQAISYLEDAYVKAKEIKSHFEILNSLKLLGDFDKPKSAYYYKKVSVVTDSLQMVAQANKDKFARIEYETEKLEDEKEALVKRNGFIIGVSAMVLLFIGAVFIIYYLNSRNKKLVMEQEQQKANEEIYQLMFEQQTKIDKARTEEKSRIAMELHDGILNNIYAVRLNLEFINRNTDEESVAQRKEYIKQLQTVESEIRGVSHDLSRNAVFYEKSFKDVIESLVLTQKNEFNTAFDVDIDDNINWENLPNIQKVNVYRVIQEGLQNINKYSVAKNAIVEIKKGYDAIELTISDDGIGYDPDKVKGGIGLRNLKKRTSVLNGSLDIISAPGKGAKIHIVFPN